MMKMCGLAEQALRSFICRSRGQLYLVLLLLLPLTGWAQSDSLTMSELPLEWLVESLPSDELSELGEDDLLELSPQEPKTKELLDLNRATQQELQARFPFLTPQQLRQLRLYRDERGGELQSVYDLKWITGWDRETIARVAPYVTVRPFAGEPYEKPKAPLTGEAYLAMSYHKASEAVPEAWYDPLKLRSAISLRQKGLWQVAAQYQRYPQELAKDGTWRYFAMYEPRLPYLDKVLLGHFKVGWGAGLLAARSVWASASALPQFTRHKSMISPSLSAMRERTLRGIASEGHWGAWRYSAFYSYSRLDGTIDERQGLIEAIRPNMRYHTPERRAQRALIPMQTVGAQLAYIMPRASLSLQTLYADWMGYDLAFMPGYKAIASDNPLQSHWLTSLAYQWHSQSRRLELQGELATEQLEHLGFIQHLHYHTPRQRDLGVTLYYMSPRFASYYGRSESHYARLGNDMGLRLYGSMRLMKRSTLRAMLELYESLEPRYHKLERSRGLLTRLYLTTRYNNQIEQLWYGQLGRSNEEALRWRLSSTLRYSLDAISLQLVGTIQQRQLEGQDEAQWGRSLTAVARYRTGVRRPLSVALSGHYYHADHVRVASYAYLPTSRYAFGLYSATGQGIATALLLQWQLAPHWTLSASMRYDRNLDEGVPRWRADSYLVYRF
ncbi:transporter [uncultured Porphyromonas sp.]|uniref:transporter n=1 Tax=uncultured Porphyromonas sp. TaxID=159274 RepID=UPI002804C00F|nr:transporter [uncultured Porphyromonas sp.]